MKQTLIFTALPHRRLTEAGSDVLKISATVSIRLDPGSPSTLAEFEDILSWTQHIKSATYRVRFGNQDLDAILDPDKIDDQLWSQLMHDKIKVKGFEQENLTEHRLMSYPSRHIRDFVLNNYQRFAISNPTKPVGMQEFRDQTGLGAISRYQPLDEKTYERLKGQKRRQELSEAEVFEGLKVDRRILERRLKIDKNTRFVPFNEEARPELDFFQFRDFHQVEKKPLSAAPAKLQKPEFEFHDVLSIVSSYPQIQRKLALVLDFTVNYQNSISSNSVLNLIPVGFNFQDQTEISCPKVAYAISNDRFFVRSEEGSVIDQGFVQVNTPAFNIFQIDADGAALKVNNQVENKIIEDTKKKIVNINLLGSKTLQAKGLPEEKAEESELPALRSAGIALARNGLAEVLHQRFQRANTFKTRLLNKNKLDNQLKIILPDDSDALFADDVVQGYRMDIAVNDEPDKWYSLHWKKDAYSYLDSNNQSHEIDDVEPDEGFIQIAAAEDTEGQKQLFSGEVMFRWEGWSLSVKKPGYAINEEDDIHDKDYVNTVRSVEAKKYQLDQDLEFKLNAIPQIVKGTLPKLRFGASYMIRVRTVDMAGNSPSLEEKTPNPGQNEIRSFTYKRYEPVASPIILLGNHLKDGESLEHMVIRSNFDQSAKDYENDHPLSNQLFDETSTRHLLPPKNSQLMAEAHGKFEMAFGENPQVAKQMYDFIISRESHFEFGDDGKDKVYQDSHVEVIYLPDPTGAGVSLFLAEGYENSHTQDFKTRLFTFFSNEELTGKSTNINIGDNEWHSGKSLRIVLKEGNRDVVWNAGQRMLEISMPKGERTRIKFSTWWRAKDIEDLSAIWDLLKQKNPGNLKALQEIAESGRHWMISPGRELELVHAVQQPVEAPGIDQMRGDRDYDQTASDIHVKIAVHGNSTLKIDLQSRWKEIIDLPHHVEPEWHDRSGEINDISVEYHDTMIQKGTFPAEQGKDLAPGDLKLQGRNEAIRQEKTISETIGGKSGNKKKGKKTNRVESQNLVSQPQISADVQSKNYAESASLSYLKVAVAPLLQQFEDTRHRRVSYRAVGASRYQDYFDGLIKQDKLPTTRESEFYNDVIIPSSARPHKPEVAYIIPTFEWRKGETATAMRHRRLGGGLRIYLKRPWYSSGENEKLAVILPGFNANTDIKTTLMAPGSGLNPNVTHWGVDPIKLSRPAGAYSPVKEQFRMSPHVDVGLSFPGNENYKVTAVAYPVEFDKERKLWYCDLAIDHGTMYYPFIKLALARYQQHSVRKNNTDVCLSEIVLPDFIQLVPERVCTIDFKKDDVNTKFTISVEGTMSLVGRQYSPTNYLKFSFLSLGLAQPLHMVIDDDTNDKDLEKEQTIIEITEKDIQNDRFSISREFRLPRKYKRDPLIVVVEEYEKSSQGSAQNVASRAQEQSDENQPRLVYADRFDINAVAE